MVLKDVNVRENGVRVRVVQKLNCRENAYDLKDHVQEEALISNWSPKLMPIKIIFLISLLNYLLEKI
jgi:hypothetical protein